MVCSRRLAVDRSCVETAAGEDRAHLPNHRHALPRCLPQQYLVRQGSHAPGLHKLLGDLECVVPCAASLPNFTYLCSLIERAFIVSDDEVIEDDVGDGVLSEEEDVDPMMVAPPPAASRAAGGKRRASGTKKASKGKDKEGEVSDNGEPVQATRKSKRKTNK